MPNLRLALALGTLALATLVGCNELPPEEGGFDSETVEGSGGGAEAIESPVVFGATPTACASLHQCYIACNRAGGDTATLDACKNNCTARTSPLGRQADAYLQGCMKAEGCLNTQGVVDGACIDQKCSFERDFCLATPPYQYALGRDSCYGVYRNLAAGVCGFSPDKAACQQRWENAGNYQFQKLLPRINSCLAQNGCVGGLFGIDNCGKDRCNEEWVECLDAFPGPTPVQSRPAAGTPNAPANPSVPTIKCQAQGTYNVCANGLCRDRGPVQATGAGTTDAEAELNAVRACITAVQGLVTANSIGDHTHATSNGDCKVTTCS
jgi:hypothetical protein